MQTPKQGLKLIIGLGNPGPEYKNTYHNAGSLFVDYLAKNGRGAEGAGSGFKLLNSDTFMNKSGSFVAKALKKNSAKPEEIAIAQDDSDLHLGEWKLSFDRGSAGHKGIESAIKAIGTREFWRIRIGIRPEAKVREKADLSVVIHGKKADLSAVIPRMKAEEFVLKNISKENKKKLEKVFEEIASQLQGFQPSTF